MKKIRDILFRKVVPMLIVTCLCSVLSNKAEAQQTYFIDGYHGGIWGHYPDWYTQFIVETLKKYPKWKINLEIEPVTWEHAKNVQPHAYQQLQDFLRDQTSTRRIEYVNPSYGQSYLYNTSGESIIRQFSYGIELVKSHFPTATFTTYSSEEPCFTSALPQILKSFGFKYASLKNPNTCWGGYTRAFGGELINWIGPDGSKLPTVPRYASEALLSGSTWQTLAWTNSPEYINAAIAQGIKNPVGMCLQDAGWRNGPWIGEEGGVFKSEYKTWTDYIENYSIKEPVEDWRFSQEDLQVSLVWGAQILQRLAQQIRVSENRIVVAEKLAAMATALGKGTWPQATLDEGWKNLLLAQHHDCWIVPYNGGNNNWANKVAKWTALTNLKSDSVITTAVSGMIHGTSNSESVYLRVFNTSGARRQDYVSVELPSGFSENLSVKDLQGNVIPVQLNWVSDKKYLVFKASVPSVGYNTYQVISAKSKRIKENSMVKWVNGICRIETDLYVIELDGKRGGVLKSLRAKGLDNKEFVDLSDNRGFNELRGNFFRDGGFSSSMDSTSTIQILEEGPLRAVVEIKGKINRHPFTQTLTVAKGQRRIDLKVKLDWDGNPGIGNGYAQDEKWTREDVRKAFYSDKEKLSVLFPMNLRKQKVFKNAPFDVVQSGLKNTFFSRWDSIKNNVILNWVDVTDASSDYGIALYTDHTTSYSHGEDFPLSLTLQYSGMGLWGRNYKINGPSEIQYSLVPHKGKWDRAFINTESTWINEPLITAITTAASKNDSSRSLLRTLNKSLEISSMVRQKDALLLRVYNSEVSEEGNKIFFSGHVKKAELVELDGRTKQGLKITKVGTESAISLSIPRFGIRTIKVYY